MASQHSPSHPSSSPFLDMLASWGPVVLRVVIGVVFAAHGYQKVFDSGMDAVSGSFEKLSIPLPYISAILATAAELVGGIALILGFATRFFAMALAFTMLVAGITVHPDSFFLPKGAEYVITLGLASVAIALQGAGRFSVDACLRARKQSN